MPAVGCCCLTCQMRECRLCCDSVVTTPLLRGVGDRELTGSTGCAAVGMPTGCVAVCVAVGNGEGLCAAPLLSLRPRVSVARVV